MNTTLNMSLRKWLILFIPWLVLALILAACAGIEEGGGGGLTNETPAVDETPGIRATDVITGATPTTEMSSTVEMTATAEMTATTKVTKEVTVEATEVITGEATAETMAPPAVLPASDFINATIQDQIGEDLGAVWEILADEDGAIQYVIVETGASSVGDNNGYPSEAITGTTGITDTAPFELTVLTWDGFSVERNEETDEPDDIVIVYSGETETVDTAELDIDFLNFLDETGYVLEGNEESDYAPPAEFIGLLQVSDYDDYELQDTAGNDLGDTEDLLVDMTEGKILYAVTDVGGFLGIGANSVAIPWNVLNLEVVADEDERTEIFTLDATEEFLSEAPAVDLNDWKPLVEDGWDAEIESYWKDMSMTS